MIRDPSDGSVRAPGAIKHPPATKSASAEENASGAMSGLPDGSKKSKDILRLERSREWLERYKRAKIEAKIPEPKLEGEAHDSISTRF